VLLSWTGIEGWAPFAANAGITALAALPLVRGRIRVADQIARRPGMPLPIEVRYDAYSTDVAEHRHLRSALPRMLAGPRKRG